MVAEVSRLVSFLLAAALAGCAAAPPDSAPIVVTPAFAMWQLDECEGLDTGFTYPMDTGPGTSPPGWTFSPLAEGRYFSYAGWSLMKCHRVSIADLEVGPVALIFETHSKLSPPEACKFGTFDYISGLHAVYTDSEVLAEALQAAQIPAKAIPIRLVLTETPSRSQDWSWSLDNNSWSSLHITAISDTGQAPDQVERMAWWTGTKLGFLDVDWNHYSPAVPVPAAFGEIQPGMLYSGDSVREFAGVADFNAPTSASAQLHFMEDSQCSASGL